MPTDGISRRRVAAVRRYHGDDVVAVAVALTISYQAAQCLMAGVSPLNRPLAPAAVPPAAGEFFAESANSSGERRVDMGSDAASASEPAASVGHFRVAPAKTAALGVRASSKAKTPGPATPRAAAASVEPGGRGLISSCRSVADEMISMPRELRDRGRRDRIAESERAAIDAAVAAGQVTRLDSDTRCDTPVHRPTPQPKWRRQLHANQGAAARQRKALGHG